MAPKKTDRWEVRVDVPTEYSSYTHISGDEFEGSPDDVIAMMTDLKAKHPTKNLRISYEQEQWETNYHFVVREVRPETDEEMEARMGKQEAQQTRQREQELALLAQLKKKYPDA